MRHWRRGLESFREREKESKRDPKKEFRKPVTSCSGGKERRKEPPMTESGGVASLDSTESSSSKVILGKYELGCILGRGASAKVYHARDISTGASVAVKVIAKNRLAASNVMREVAIMRRLRHPNVVRLLEVLASRTRIYFVMEYIKGGELFARLDRSGRVPEDQARRYFRQLISAVDFCHSRSVSHRDLKPENLLLDEDGNLKVSDFGLSALPEQLRHDGLLHTQCGTPAYVAPEVLRKKGYDGAAADLWSCGVILFVLLAGFLPFQHENLMTMYRMIFKADYKTPPWLSPDARRLISRLLIADPAKRISIPAIMQHPWVKRGSALPPPRSLSAPPAPLFPLDDDAITAEAEEKGSPRFYNAFELIAAMSSGFDLSGLFESRPKAGTVFTSRAGAGAIVDRLMAVGKKLGFGVEQAKGGCGVRMEGRAEGRKGRLAVTAEVFEAAPQVAIVEFRKSSGDTLEYAKFCEEDIRPGLQDIVWTWQGDDTGGERCKG